MAVEPSEKTPTEKKDCYVQYRLTASKVVIVE